MIVYLAGTEATIMNPGYYIDGVNLAVKEKADILQSFYYLRKNQDRYPFGYMLDSGAFSLLSDKGSISNIPAYVDRYIEYINRNEIKLYFELDIDPIIGYDEVKRIRRYLYEHTGVQPIPVWHKSRGIEDFKKMCQEYDYVAIGGYVIKELKRSDLKYLPRFISYAHRCNTKIHGLGFTSMKYLTSCHFDSVDSTSWLGGGQYGFIYRFDGRKPLRIDKPNPQMLRKEAKLIHTHNFKEWVKFQRYAKENL